MNKPLQYTGKPSFGGVKREDLSITLKARSILIPLAKLEKREKGITRRVTVQILDAHVSWDSRELLIDLGYRLNFKLLCLQDLASLTAA